MASSDRVHGFRRLYAAHVDRVWRLMRRLGVREADIEDATQDVFTIAALRWSSFEGGSDWAWLASIASKVASNHRRLAVHRRENLEELPGAEIPHEAPGADEEIGARQARGLVLRALETLSDEQREVFVLHELEGMSVAEMSRAAGVSVNTLYSRLRLGRDAFTRTVRQLNGERGEA